MIYTITFNPALDYTAEVKNFEIGKVNRTKSENIFPGGKGLNVSMVLKALGAENTALGFVAGFTGKELERILNEKDIKTNFIEVDSGLTRINVKISSKEETAINGCGPNVSQDNIEDLLRILKELKAEDIVILSGNIPKNVDDNIYEKIAKILFEKKIKFVVDASEKLLLSTLKYNPFLIKPNKEELEETLKLKLDDEQSMIDASKKLQELGAQNVLISLGGDGAVLITNDGKIYKHDALKIKVINTVGAGDSMVAGFMAGFIEKQDLEYAFKLGIASGTATAASIKLATKEEIMYYLFQI